jgi:DNA-binding IclR family transcriptional regulator
VHGADGGVVAALSISGPSVRIGRDQLESLGHLLTREAAALSSQLGHTTDTSRKAGAA